MDIVWQSLRRVAVAILAGLLRRRSEEDIEARLTQRPMHEQVVIVTAVLAGLLFTSLLFANAGVIGLLVFFLLVIIVVK